MLAIELVRVIRNGQAFYIGRRFQDRHNLMTLGIRNGVMPAERNQSTLKRLRRANGDFTFTVVRNQLPLPMTASDHAMLGNVVVGLAA